MSNKYSYPCVVITKPEWGFKMVQFFIEASDMSRWCGVYRKNITDKGYQRILKKKHYEQIAKYLNNEGNVIPNSMVIAFNDKLDIEGDIAPGAELSEEPTESPVDAAGDPYDGFKYGNARINVRVHPDCDKDDELDEEEVSAKRSAYIIDGQHRMAGGNASSRDSFFPVTAFLGVSKEDQAFHFIVINRQSQKVSKHDIDAVIPKAIYDKLQDRLVSASIINSDADLVYALDNSSDSPFLKSIKWANNSDTNAPINKGAIDKLIKFVRQLPEDVLNEISDEYETIRAIWAGVKRHLDPVWSVNEFELNASGHYENQFKKKVVAVIPALQKAINKCVEFGTIECDCGDPSKSLEDSVYKWVSKIPIEMFYCVWNNTSITNDSRIEELSANLILAARTKKVPYNEKGNGWFSKPKSLEEIQAQKEAAKQAKADERKAARDKARAAKLAKKKAVKKKAVKKKSS